jgi:hypothetical protein
MAIEATESPLRSASPMKIPLVVQAKGFGPFQDWFSVKKIHLKSDIHCLDFSDCQVEDAFVLDVAVCST